MCDMLSQRECRRAFQCPGLVCVGVRKLVFWHGFHVPTTQSVTGSFNGAGELPEPLSHGGLGRMEVGADASDTV